MEANDPFKNLARAETVTIDQKSLPLESCLKCFGCCCADFENMYDILVPGEQGVYRFQAKEESGTCCRICCNPNHELTLHVRDDVDNRAGKGEVLKIHKPYKCCCLSLCSPCQREITVYRTLPAVSVIGYVKQPCLGGLFTPTLNMYKENGGRPIGTIRGPCCCIGGCCKSEFEIQNTEGNQIGTIKRGGIKDIGMKRALLSNSDKFQLSFDDPMNTSVDDKLVKRIASAMFARVHLNVGLSCVIGIVAVALCPAASNALFQQKKIKSSRLTDAYVELALLL